ncbi:hypothetical protein [Kineococcus arenarius]|uniref:hypothetical protein n=1 Tax=unclassified Kineococcus TaxID=2621656 RepID=UPI003D7EFCAB
MPVYVVSLVVDEARPDAESSSGLQRQVVSQPRVVQQRWDRSRFDVLHRPGVVSVLARVWARDPEGAYRRAAQRLRWSWRVPLGQVRGARVQRLRWHVGRRGLYRELDAVPPRSRGGGPAAAGVRRPVG